MKLLASLIIAAFASTAAFAQSAPAEPPKKPSMAKKKVDDVPAKKPAQKKPEQKKPAKKAEKK